MAHTLDIKAVADNGTSFYYREEHGWKYLGDEGFAHFLAKGQQAAEHAKAAAGKKEDGADITLTLSSVVDGNPQPDTVVPGLSQEAFTHLQRKAHAEGDAILALGEKHAKEKAHGKR
jgi:hypothetical protein